MPANPRQQVTQSPALPTSQSSSKYTNKDGSKFITIPKVSSSTDSSETSPNMAQTTSKTNGQVPNAPSNTQSAGTSVNRKKQKRRQKQAEQAARLAAAGSGQNGIMNGTSKVNQNSEPAQPNSPSNYDEVYRQQNGRYDPTSGDRPYDSDDEVDGYSGSYENSVSPSIGYSIPPTVPPTKSKKKKGKGKNAQADQAPRSIIPLPSEIAATTRPGMSKEKIWNTSSQEERERIKVFWLSLGEEERRSLVKVEKDAVLKKMKEQQKHSCSCTVCGRKRIAIEEELEVLYDAYYEELEQYANNQQGDGPPPLMVGSRRFGALSGLAPPNRLPPAFTNRHASRGRIVEHFDNEDDEGDGDEEYSEDDVEEEDYLSDEEPVEDIPRSHATDFFNFGQSLTVQGGILTVADDLLKNDGKKFIEMMEQLAERRMAREEDAKEQYPNSNSYMHMPNTLPPHSHHHHNHPPQLDEEEYDDEEEDEEDYDSQEYDDEDEDMDTMTEEQRMEEGRRMFQIFAARMFEQRVLTAYKEKVAAERQEKLLQELDEEDMAVMQKKAKKAKEAQKKKEKAQQKKLALAEEKAKREAEKAALEAALRAEEAKKAEEARIKAEEKRKKREAQKKAEEEERLRKEAEKQRRIQEQRERQAELERKQREAKEREKREREELRQKEREAKEREARERKEKQDKERKEAEMKAKAERESQEQRRREEQASQSSQNFKRQQAPVPAHIGPQSSQNHSVPHIPVAIPAVPKAPTPGRPSIASQRDVGSVPQTPQFGSAKSQSASPNPSTPLQGSPVPQSQPGRTPSQPFLHHPQANSPMHATLKTPLGGFQPGPFPGMQPMNMGGFQPGIPLMAPGFGGRMHHEPIFPHQPIGNQYRPLAGPNGMPMHPVMNGIPMPQGRGFPLHNAPPGFPQQMPNGVMSGMSQVFSNHKEGPPAHIHSRQQSGSYDKQAFENQPGGAPSQPIARPAPIGRPGSVVQGHRSGEGSNDIDDLSNHLGSSALLDDSDEPITSGPNTRRASAAPGSLGRQGGFGPGPYGMDPSAFSSPGGYGAWGGPPNPFGPSSLPGSGYMGGWGNHAPNGFGGVPGLPIRPSQPRSVAVRLMLCRACKILEGSSPDGFHQINAVRDQIERLNPPRDEPVSDKELLDLCETEGNPNNGGGFFDIRTEADGRILIRYEPDAPSTHRSVGAPGDNPIGSPVVGTAGMIPMSRFPGVGPPGISAPGAVGGF